MAMRASKETKNTHKLTHIPQETNKQQPQKKKTQKKKKGLTNMQLYTCSTLFPFFLLYIILQSAVTARQVDDVKIPILNS